MGYTKSENPCGFHYFAVSYGSLKVWRPTATGNTHKSRGRLHFESILTSVSPQAKIDCAVPSSRFAAVFRQFLEIKPHFLKLHFTQFHKR